MGYSISVRDKASGEEVNAIEVRLVSQGAAYQATVAWQSYIKVGFGPSRGDAAQDVFEQFAQLDALSGYDLQLAPIVNKSV